MGAKYKIMNSKNSRLFPIINRNSAQVGNNMWLCRIYTTLTTLVEQYGRWSVVLWLVVVQNNN